MEVEERIKVVKDSLITSFVEGYKAYKNTIELINKDFKKSNIHFRYSYDQFCLDYLNQSLDYTKAVDIFKITNYAQFGMNFEQFCLYNVECMVCVKLEKMGYNFQKYYQTSEMKKKISY